MALIGLDGDSLTPRERTGSQKCRHISCNLKFQTGLCGYFFPQSSSPEATKTRIKSKKLHGRGRSHSKRIAAVSQAKVWGILTVWPFWDPFSKVFFFLASLPLQPSRPSQSHFSSSAHHLPRLSKSTRASPDNFHNIVF